MPRNLKRSREAEIHLTVAEGFLCLPTSGCFLIRTPIGQYKLVVALFFVISKSLTNIISGESNENYVHMGVEN